MQSSEQENWNFAVTSRKRKSWKWLTVSHFLSLGCFFNDYKTWSKWFNSTPVISQKLKTLKKLSQPHHLCRFSCLYVLLQKSHLSLQPSTFTHIMLFPPQRMWRQGGTVLPGRRKSNEHWRLEVRQVSWGTSCFQGQGKEVRWEACRLLSRTAEVVLKTLTAEISVTISWWINTSDVTALYQHNSAVTTSASAGSPRVGTLDGQEFRINF